MANMRVAIPKALVWSSLASVSSPASLDENGIHISTPPEPGQTLTVTYTVKDARGATASSSRYASGVFARLFAVKQSEHLATERGVSIVAANRSGLTAVAYGSYD